KEAGEAEARGSGDGAEIVGAVVAHARRRRAVKVRVPERGEIDRRHDAFVDLLVEPFAPRIDDAVEIDDRPDLEGLEVARLHGQTKARGLQRHGEPLTRRREARRLRTTRCPLGAYRA